MGRLLQAIRRRLNGPSSGSIDVVGPWLHLGVAGLCGREDGVAEPGDTSGVEGLVAIDQKGGDGRTVRSASILWGRILGFIDSALELAIVPLVGKNVRSHHIHTPKLESDLGRAHWTFASGVFAVASHALKPVRAPR
jgi:hypothetical protein